MTVEVWVQARSLGDPAEAMLFDKVEPQDCLSFFFPLLSYSNILIEHIIYDTFSFQLCMYDMIDMICDFRCSHRQSPKSLRPGLGCCARAAGRLLVISHLLHSFSFAFVPFVMLS